MQITNPDGYSGLLLMDSRLTPDTWSGLAADLTQAGPTPGTPIPQQAGTEAQPKTHGTQDDTRYVLRAQRGGFVGKATFAWATQDETGIDSYRGCNFPNFAQDIRHAGGKVITATNGPAAQCTTSSDRVVRVWAEKDTSSPFYIRVYAAYSDDLITWTGHGETVLILSEDPADTDQYYGVTLDSIRCVAVRWDEARSVVQLFVRVTGPGASTVNYHLFESAEGATWAIVQTNILVENFTPNVPTGMRQPLVYALAGAYSLLQPEDDGASYYLTQWCGSDRGRTFELLASDTTTSDYTGFCVAEFLGKAVLSLVQPSTGDVKVATVGSAFDGVLSASFQTVTGMTSESEACLCVLHGMLYLLHTNSSMSGVAVSVSRSGGYDDFDQFGHDPFSYDSASHHVDIEDIVASPHGGGIAFGYRATDTGVSSSVRGMHFVHRLGGWCTRTLPPVSPIVGGEGRAGFGPVNSSVDTYYQVDRSTWYPLIDPATLGYTATGAGTSAFAHTAGGSPAWTVSCTAGQARYWYQEFDAAFKAGILVFFDLEVGTGGDSAANDSAVRVILGDGVYEYRLAIRLTSSDSIYLKDENTGAGATRMLTSPMSTRRRLLVAVREYDSTTPLARARIYGAAYSSEGVLQDLAELGGITLTKDATPSYTRCRIEWGVVSTVSAVAITQSWYAVHYLGAAGQASIHDLSALSSVSEDYPAQLGGAPCSSSPATVSGGLRVSWSGGPAKHGEVWEVDPRYSYAREHIYPSLYPSPRMEWRSQADGVAMTFQWDYDTSDILEGFESASIGVFLHRVNFRQARLIGVDEGGADVDLITLDSSGEFTNLPYYAPTAAGATGPYLTVDPDGTGRADRVIQENEFAGGTAKIGSAYYKIRKNTAGSWDPAATGKKPRIWLETWDGGLTATTGQVTLIPPSALAIVHGLGGTHFKRIKLFIPGQDTPDGFYRIGQVVIGPVYLFDKRYSHGRVTSRTANTSVEASLSGARSAVRNGPTSREVKFGWFEGQDTVQVNSGYASAEPDYVTPGESDSNDYAVSMRGELQTTLDGIYDALSGPLTPVVYIAQVPYGELQVTITRPDGCLYGRTTEPLEITTVRGTETVDEVFQVAQVTISEDV